MIYTLFFTIWLSTGEVATASHQAVFNNKPVSNQELCNKLAEEAEKRLSIGCFKGSACERVEVSCKRVERKEYFSERHRKYGKETHEINKKRKRKVRSSEKH